MKFRPCIDLHQGKVKQIVGSTLGKNRQLQTNFEARQPPAYFSRLYKAENLRGGHVIQLGQGNLEAAKEALAAWPGGMQIGGGIHLENAVNWLERGAEKVIVTSFVFQGGQVNEINLKALSKQVGPGRLALDLSVRKKAGRYFIVTDLWQNFTEVELTHSQLGYFSQFASEFLIHAVDVEGKGCGVDHELIHHLGQWAGLPMTYAGGISSWEDVAQLQNLGRGALDFTVGSALDLFGGTGLKFTELALAQKKEFACLP